MFWRSQDRFAGEAGCTEMTIVPDAEDFCECFRDPLVAGGMRDGIPQPLTQLVDWTWAAEIFADDIGPRLSEGLPSKKASSVAVPVTETVHAARSIKARLSVR